MTKARKTQAWLPGVDILRDALAKTSAAAASLTSDGIDSVFHAFGVVSDRDLSDIRRTLARLEKRLARIESRRKPRAPLRSDESEERRANHAF